MNCDWVQQSNYQLQGYPSDSLLYKCIICKKYIYISKKELADIFNNLEKELFSAQPPCKGLINEKKHKEQIIKTFKISTSPETKPIGPGDHLHALIIQFTGESTKLGCGCKDRINQMNRWGVVGCTKNIDRIVTWMQEEATKRGWKSAKWLGSKMAIKLLIRLAIRRAKNTKDSI